MKWKVLENGNNRDQIIFCEDKEALFDFLTIMNEFAWT